MYREGFETTLFLQALTLEAGAWTVLQGVMIGFAAVVAVFFLVVSLERRLPHKKMLIVTGVMITWVLVVLVGQTVQVMQKVGWIPVTPIEGLAASVLERRVARDLPHLGGSHRPVRGRGLRRRQLLRGRDSPSPEAVADPDGPCRVAGRRSSTGGPTA